MNDGSRTTSEFRRHTIFFGLLVALIAAAIVRSCITTSLDSFTFDEAYHVGAGASYIKTGDFRLNPEHPPLAKLWVGAYVAAMGYEMSEFRSYTDKGDEREAVEQDAYFKNEPDLLQERTRTAMFALNGLLLLLFALAVRHLFSDAMALGATLFLVIDPTIAAHLPVLMTDLPVALTSGTAVLLAVAAFRSFKAVDLILASVALGLALSAKHSAIITAAVVGSIAVGFAVYHFCQHGIAAGAKRLAVVALVFIGTIVVLWSFYGFRYYETPGTTDETFNRPLETKIADIKSPVYRGGLNVISTTRLLPRAYIWGLADTIRAGAEGRAIPILAFGEMYYSKGPFYYFPGVIATKLPIGLALLVVLGVICLISGKVPKDFFAPLFGLTFLAGFFLIFLIIGSSYGGVRHALPIFPLLAVLGAIPIYLAVRDRSYVFGAISSLLLIAAIVSAVPSMRPWEYFNESVGGSAGAWQYFSDEGVDLGLRLEDIDRYYEANLAPSGEIPVIMYFSSDVERDRREIEYVGKDPKRDADRIGRDTFEGTVFIGANELSPKLWWDAGSVLRGHEPIGRMGNVFIFRGTFARPLAAISRSRFYRAIYTKLYVAEPDITGGIALLKESAELDPTAFMVTLELGNQYLKLNDRENSLASYRKALEHAPASDSISDLLREQVARLESDEAIENIPQLRNPSVE
jgi:hypothetical protein